MDRGAERTRLLLACGAAAGPLFAAVALVQAVARSGFDLTRHQLSLLSNGDLGWIQTGNFLTTGLLFSAGAIGMSRVLRSGPASRWGPRLIGIVGAGLIGAGSFRADPAFGFPPGTPSGFPTTVTWQGGLHLVVATVAFLSLIAACFVFSRRFARRGQRLWAATSTAVGVLLLLAVAANGAMAGQAVANVGFTAAALVAFGWASAVAASLLVDVAASRHA